MPPRHPRQPGCKDLRSIPGAIPFARRLYDIIIIAADDATSEPRRKPQVGRVHCAQKSPSSAPDRPDCCSGSCCTGTASTSDSGAAERGTMCSAASAPACSSRARSTLLDEVGVGARAHAEGLVHDGIELAFGGARHRIDLKAADRQDVMIYGQTEVTLDLMNARKAAGLHLGLRGRATSAARFRRPTTRASPMSRTGSRHGIDCDFIAGCDGFHGVSRASVPAAAIEDYRARSIRSAGSASSPRRRRSRHELIYVQPRPRLRAVHHALDHAQPLLRAVPARRSCRPMAATSASGTS